MILRIGGAKIDCDRGRSCVMAPNSGCTRKAFDLLLVLLDKRPKCRRQGRADYQARVAGQCVSSDANLAI
jgi:hypothetical protein